MESLEKKKNIYIREALLFLVFLMYGVSSVNASHIVGGTIDYEFIEEDGSNNLYKVDLTVYADCSNSGSFSLFDYPAYVGIYRGNDNYELFDTVNVWPFQRETIDNPTFSCLVTPSNICVKEGTYSFDIWLPRSDESYYIVYQRCCRNATISNIINPELSGSTYFVEITALSQSYRNSSPKFEIPPPSIFCVNDTFNLNTSVIDDDGDSIVYEFCTPYLGGGTTNDDVAGIFSCLGTRPNPPCPPPYTPVLFNPQYEVDTPISGNVTINTLDGYIEGSANTLGQFVYAICAKEYRDGEYLGKVSRDFQVNTIFCPELVNARIDIALDTIRECYGTSATFNNTSTLEDSIYSFFWIFKNDNYLDTIYEWNPGLSTLASGIYQSSLMLNPDHLCKDTLAFFVEIYPALEPDFYFDYDSCSMTSINFLNQSESSYSTIENFHWDFAGLDSSNMVNPDYSFEIPEVYPVNLTIKDNLECYASVTKNLPWFPLPSEISVRPKYSDPKCIPLKLEVESNFTPRINFLTGYSYSWRVSDISVTDNYSPIFDIVDSGYFDLSLSMTSINGCELDTIFRDFAYTPPPPKAVFSYTPNAVSSVNPIITFINESLNASYNSWYVNNELIGFNENNIEDYTFDVVGLQEVMLVVENEEGCLDSMIQTIDIIPDFTYFLPNAFTPNGDGKNEVFKGEGVLTEVSRFSMMIFDRWGSKIYETENIADGWNGRKNNNGAILPNGAYQYIIRVVSTREKESIFKGTVILLK